MRTKTFETTTVFECAAIALRMALNNYDRRDILKAMDMYSILPTHNCLNITKRGLLPEVETIIETLDGDILIPILCFAINDETNIALTSLGEDECNMWVIDGDGCNLIQYEKDIWA